MRRAALVLVGLALTGCETTAEKSAKLEKAAKRVTIAKQKGLSITRPSTVVEVVSTAIVHSSEGTAAVVTLRNSSARAMREVPLAITIKSAQGSPVYSNDTPGLARTLVAAALVPAHGRLTWIDDQIQPTGTPASVSAKVGEGAPLVGALPQVSLYGVHLHEDPSGLNAEGTATNHSRVTQQELVIYAVARRAGKLVAAGRAVLASLPGGSSTPFQVFFIGDPRGAQLQLSAPPTTLG